MEAKSRKPELPGLPRGLELRHLRYLAAAVDQGSFRAAALHLGISQPVLSRQIGDLEYLVGVPLVSRVGRGVVPTEAGHVLRSKTVEIETALAELTRVTRAAPRSASGRCVLGFVGTPDTVRLIRTVTARCAERWPELALACEDTTSALQPAAVREARIDVGLCHALPSLVDGPGLRYELLLDDAIDCALVATSHPFAARDRLTAADLADVPFLFVPRSFHPGFFDAVQKALAGIGLAPRGRGSFESLHALWSFTAEGQGWALGFHSHLKRPPTGLKAVPLEGFHVPWGLALLWRAGETSPNVARVLATIRESAPALS